MKINAQVAHIHHYVPQWYQRRFLKSGEFKFYYLDLHPDLVQRNDIQFRRRSLLRWGPARCFHKKDLYSIGFGQFTTDDIEKIFFGNIDRNGRDAVGLLSEFEGMCEGLHEALRHLSRYMDAQKFRTPRGLDQLKSMTNSNDRNVTLLKMPRAFQFHMTMWLEGIWEIVSAGQFYNQILSDG